MTLTASFLTLTASFLMGVGSAAAAKAPTLSPGVHVDPGSPAAKEYAIPLAQARGGGSGSGSGGQLFGRGITRAPTPAAVGRPTTTAAAPAQPQAAVGTPVKRSRPGRHRSGAHRRAGPAPQANHHAAAAAPPSRLSGSARPVAGAAGIAWMLGVAALVLVLGGLGVVVLARHSRRASTRTS